MDFEMLPLRVVDTPGVLREILASGPLDQDTAEVSVEMTLSLKFVKNVDNCFCSSSPRAGGFQLMY
jgi:hypothetical protein